MNRTQRGLVLIAVLVVAALLAFPLRDAIYELIVIPAAFVAWNLQLFYRSFSQGIWWWVIFFLVLVMLVMSLVPQARFRPRTETKPKPPQGQVEGLAIWILRAEKGIYFKWLIANRLGRLAYQMLLHRESGRPRSVFAPLLGNDWAPRKDVQQYLESGLHRSFADFPNTGGRFATPQQMGQITLAGLEIEVLTDTDAIAFGRWMLALEARSSHGFFTVQLKKIEGSWLFVSDHASSAI